jgi:hypothetical protein
MERMRDEAVKLLRENFEPSETVEAFISLLEFIISRSR